MLFRSPDPRVSVLSWMPVDDENCMIWAIEYHPNRPLNDDEMRWSREGLNYIHVEKLPDSDRPAANRDNDYLIDRERQATRSYTGIHGLGLQDSAIQESMGAIADRTIEHLNRGDEAIIKVRNHLLKMLKGNAALPGIDPASYRVRAGFFDTAKGQSLEQGLAAGGVSIKQMS